MTQPRHADAARRGAVASDDPTRRHGGGVPPAAGPRVAPSRSPSASRTARAEVGGVHMAAWRSGDRLEIRVGFDPAEIADRAAPRAGDAEVNGPSPGPLCVILDDGGAAEPYWAPDARAAVSPMTSLVFEIARRLGPEERGLLIAFLGLGRLTFVERGPDCADLERRLQDVRRVEDPTVRGRYVKPVIEALEVERDGLGRGVLIAANPVWDLEEWDPEGRIRLLWLSPDPAARGPRWATPRPALFPDPGMEAGRRGARASLDVDLLDTCFRRRADGLDQVTLRLGKAAPLRWLPAEGVLTRGAGEWRLRWHRGSATAAAFRVRVLAGPAPAAVTGHVRRRRPAGGGFDDIRLGSPCVEAEVAPLPAPRPRVLPAPDLDRWRALCDPAQRCATCGRPGGHLLHRRCADLWGRPILDSHAEIGRGWLCQRAGDPGWTVFDTGVGLGGGAGAVVLVDGAPHWIGRDGQGRGVGGVHVEALRRDDDEFVLETDDGTWHVAPVRRGPTLGEAPP